MNEASMWKPALIAGVILGILSSLPFVSCFCCAWMIGGGILAAYLYVKDSPAAITLGRGVALGLLAGFIGAIVKGLFSIPLYMLSQSGAGYMEELRQTVEKMPNMPPESRKLMQSLFEDGRMGTVIYALGYIFMLFTSCLLSMVGGAIGVAIFEKRKPGGPFAMIPPDQPPYQPPTSMPPPAPPTDEQ
jgi:hypothetical protein